MKRKLGFTLMETMISMALFGVLMIILFAAVNGFQRNWLKEYAKQDVNASFVRVYRAIDDDLSKSSSTFFHYYNENDSYNASNKGSPSLMAKRWCMFPITDAGVDNDGFPSWKYIVVYYLRIPAKDKCQTAKGATTETYCPHKQLVRVLIEIPPKGIMTESGVGHFNNTMQDYVRYCMSALTSTVKAKDAVGTGNIKDIRVIDSDIVDLTIKDRRDDRVTFDLMLLRIADAQKYIEIGKTQLIGDNVVQPTATTKAKKYLEETSWTTMTRND